MVGGSGRGRPRVGGRFGFVGSADDSDSNTINNNSSSGSNSIGKTHPSSLIVFLLRCACKKVLRPEPKLRRADQVWPLRVWGGDHYGAAHGGIIIGGRRQSGEGVLRDTCTALVVVVVVFGRYSSVPDRVDDKIMC